MNFLIKSNYSHLIDKKIVIRLQALHLLCKCSIFAILRKQDTKKKKEATN